MGKTQILSSARLAQGAAFLRSLLLSAAVAAIALAGARSAHASGNVCADGAACSTSGVRDDDRYFRFSTAIGQQTPQREGALRRVEFDDQDYSSFSGVGLMVCTVDGKRRSNPFVHPAHALEKQCFGRLDDETLRWDKRRIERELAVIETHHRVERVCA